MFVWVFCNVCFAARYVDGCAICRCLSQLHLSVLAFSYAPVSIKTSIRLSCQSHSVATQFIILQHCLKRHRTAARPYHIYTIIHHNHRVRVVLYVVLIGSRVGVVVVTRLAGPGTTHPDMTSMHRSVCHGSMDLPR